MNALNRVAHIRLEDVTMLSAKFSRKRVAVRRTIAEAMEPRAYLTAVAFATPVPIPIANSAATAGVFTSSVSADFNGDGLPDYATLDRANQTLDVMINNGNGTFSRSQTLATGRQPDSLQAVALTNGNIDLLFVNSVDATAEFYTGDGNGTFATTPTTFSIGSAQSSSFAGTVTADTINAADVTGDGFPDILVGTTNGALITLLNNGSGQFNQQEAVQGGLGASGNFFNSTNTTDVVNALPNGDIQIFTDHGAGLALTSAATTVPNTLANQSSYQLAGNIVVGDFNNDGNLDIAAVITDSQTNTSYVSTLLGNGDGTFQTPVLTTITSGATRLQVGSFTGGSNEDLLALYSDQTAVLTGNGNGTFTAASVSIPESGWNSTAIADFNNDGLFDVVFGNQLLLDTTGLTTTRTFVSSTANPVAPGQSVTLKASVTGAGGTPSGNVAFFDTTSATSEKLLGVGKLTGGAANISVGLGNTAATHRIVAEYLGDTKFAAGSSTALSESVEKNAGIPIGPTILTPTVVKESLPGSAPAGTKLTNASVTVRLTNASAIDAKGPVTINLYAAVGTTLDTSVDTLLTHVSKSESLKLTKSSNIQHSDQVAAIEPDRRDVSSDRADGRLGRDCVRRVHRYVRRGCAGHHIVGADWLSQAPRHDR